jgi:hypothetical protein
MNKHLFLAISIFVGLGIMIASVVYGWTNPTAAPPGANPPAPINVGPVTQTKTGGLNIQGNVGIGTTAPGAMLEIFGRPGTQRITTIPAGTTGTYTLRWDGFQICQFGTCCPPWRDCDGDGRTYMAGTDCDEGCHTCFVGSTAHTPSPDGRDQNCNGVVDERAMVAVGAPEVIFNSASGLTCDQVCGSVAGRTCVSIGTDLGGTNWEGVQGGIAHGLCTRGPAGCTFWARDDGWNCEGHRASWTHCRCQRWQEVVQ